MKSTPSHMLLSDTLTAEGGASNIKKEVQIQNKEDNQQITQEEITSHRIGARTNNNLVYMLIISFY
jgi:hypothetical protein